jgi:hypothetical protein
MKASVKQTVRFRSLGAEGQIVECALTMMKH